MKLLLILSLLFSLSSPAFAKNKKAKRAVANSSLSADFQAATGLTEGVYVLKKGLPLACLQGPLDIRKVDGQLTILISENGLFSGITMENNSTSYNGEGCKHTVTNERSGSVLTSVRTRVCGKDTTIIRKKMVITSTGLTYSIVGELNGKATTNVSCELEKRK
jgi:hypothetical protein